MNATALIEQLLALPDRAAQEHFLQTLRASQHDEVAASLKGRADHYLRAQVGRSLELADLLLYLASLSQDPHHRALGLLAQANAQSIGQGDHQAGLEQYEQAQEIYRRHGRPVDEARAMIGKLYALANLGRYDDALVAGKWASQVLEADEAWLQLGKLTANLGIIQGRRGQDAAALAQFDKAVAIYRELGEEGTPFMARVEYSRAIVLRNLGRFEESIQASRQATALLAGSDQRADIARAQQSLAITLFVLGRYNEGLALLQEVRELFLADGRQRDAILVELFASDCLLSLRRFTQVLEKCRQVRHLFAGLGTHSEVAQALVKEAAAYAGLRRPDEAQTLLNQARGLFEAEGNQVGALNADLELAALMLDLGQAQESLALGARCASAFVEHGLPIPEAQAQLIAAQAALQLGQDQVAGNLVARALATGRQHGIDILTYQGEHLIGRLAQARGDRQAALSAYEQAVQELERLRGRLMVEYRAGFLEDKQVVYEDAVGLCLDLEEADLGLAFAERAKSRSLLDLLANRLDLGIEARNPEDAPLVEGLLALRAERDRLSRRQEGGEELEGKPYGHHDSEDIRSLERRITDLWHELLVRNADYARDAALWQVRTEPIQPYLDQETLVVEYFSVHDQPIAFLITAQGVEVRKLPADWRHIKQAMRLLQLNLKGAARVEPHQAALLTVNAQRLLQQLYAGLLAPLEDRLQAHRQLIIVPHGPLHYLPFHALYDGHHYLLERHEVSYLPGASILHYCKQAETATGRAVVLGHSQDGRLPHAAQEARSIASLLGGQALVEEAATRARLQQVAGSAAILHLATHGDFRPDDPLFSGLALADGWLTTLDIFSLRLRASLVTLSACQTGRSVVGGGDELLGLMRALLYAGAASLLLSFWSVEDRSTATLMEHFYRSLAAGHSKRAALRQAQLAFIQNPDMSGPLQEAARHPHYWAPFFLVGDPGPL